MKVAVPIEIEKEATEGEFMSGEEVETIKRMISNWGTIHDWSILPHAVSADKVRIFALAKRLGVELPG